MARALAEVFSGPPDEVPFPPDHICGAGCPPRGHGRAVFVAALLSAGDMKMSAFSRPKPYRTLFLRGPAVDPDPPGALTDAPLRLSRRPVS
jgi:hypothetical protein